MKHTLRRHVLATGMACTAVVALASTAWAGDPDPNSKLEDARARCIEAIEVRQTEIGELSALAASAPQLTDSHEGTIKSFLSAASIGLAALQVEIEGDQDLAELREDCTAIFDDYRIFALRAPQVHLAVAGDREAAALAKAATLVPRLQEAIDAAAAAGEDVTVAVELMAHLQEALAHAEATLTGVVDTELGFSPEQWNANHSLLSATTSAIRAVHTDLQTAVSDGRAIIAELKG